MLWKWTLTVEVRVFEKQIHSSFKSSQVFHMNIIFPPFKFSVKILQSNEFQEAFTKNASYMRRLCSSVYLFRILMLAIEKIEMETSTRQTTWRMLNHSVWWDKICCRFLSSEIHLAFCAYKVNCIFYSTSLRHVRMFICCEYISHRLVRHNFFSPEMTKESWFFVGDFRRIEFVISCRISNVTLPPVPDNPYSIQSENVML